MGSLKTNTVLNVVQNICKILFPLITIPYASRILEASNYGRVSFGNSIVRYFILLSALGVSTYAQREAPGFRENRSKITDFSNQVFSINVYATILSYVVLIILLTASYKLRNYTILILIQSTSIILTTLGADWINVVYEDYLFITLRYVAMQCLSLAMLFLFVKTSSDYYIYAAINVAATAGGNIFNIFYIRRYVKLRLINPMECIQHLKPILILFCVSATTVIYVSSDITILGYFMSDVDVGIYTMASNIYSVVKQVISAVIVVSISRMAYYLGNEQEENYKILAQKVMNVLISLLLPAISGLAFLSFDILNIMGGHEYILGQFALIVLSVALFFAIIAGFYCNCYLLLVKKDKIYLLATALSAVANIGLNFVLIPRLGIIGAAITTLIAELIMTLVSLSRTPKEYKYLVGKNVLLSSAIGAFVIGVICKIVCSMNLNSITTISVSFILGSGIYYIVMKIAKNPIVENIVGMVKKVI